MTSSAPSNGCSLLVVGPLLDGAEHAAELRSELPQPGMILRQDVDPWRGVRNPRRLQHRRREQGADRVPSAGLIAHNAGGRGRAKLGRYCRHRILVERAELVLPPVGALEAKRFGLLSTAPLGGRESAGEAVQVEHRRLERCGPEIPVVAAEEPPLQPAGLVLGSRRDGERLTRLRPIGDRLRLSRGRQGQGKQSGETDRPVPVTYLRDDAYLRKSYHRELSRVRRTRPASPRFQWRYNP